MSDENAYLRAVELECKTAAAAGPGFDLGKSGIDTMLTVESVRRTVESMEKWKNWANRMPALRFDPDWDVYVIPPYGGALSRFHIRKGDRFADVYFDAYSRLGWMFEDAEPIPYFELYPWEDDCKRYLFDETEEMMRDIRTILNGEGEF